MIASPALSPADLANTVTGWATLLCGVVILLLCRFVRRQPARWTFAYACIVVTGVPTVLFHGFGGGVLRVCDTGTNLLLAWALQRAVLGDYYSRAAQRRVALASAAVNLLAVAWMVREAATGVAHHLIPLGGFGGFTPGESVLILDAFLVTGLFYARRRRIPGPALPLLHCVVAAFVVGLGLASAGNETVHGRIVSYHALWHVVGAFGFVLLWAFNHVRLESEGE